jgi:hypothetical protein
LILEALLARCHSRRQATRDLREWGILAGEPKAACEVLALCTQGTCENRKAQKKILKIYPMNKNQIMKKVANLLFVFLMQIIGHQNGA